MENTNGSVVERMTVDGIKVIGVKGIKGECSMVNTGEFNLTAI